MKEINEITKKEDVYPSEIIKGLDIIYSDSAVVKTHITAPLMKHFTVNIKEPYEEMPEGVYIEFFNEKNEVKSTMKAKYAIRYDQTKKMEARDHVVVVNENGETLLTDQLVWDELTRKIKTYSKVTICTKKDTIRGSGMEANEDFSEWEITKPVGNFGVNDSTEKKNDSITPKK